MSPIDENAKDGDDLNLENIRTLKDFDNSVNALNMYASDGMIKATTEYDRNGVIGR